MQPTTPMDKATRLVRALLADNPTPSKIQIAEAVSMVIPLVSPADGFTALEKEILIRHLESLFNIWIDTGVSLDDSSDHIEWLSIKKSQLEWNFWERYNRYLEDIVQLPPAAVRRLDESVDMVLKRLEDPSRSGAWDRRGLVVGQVQSGKTSNYTGLICKAADAGYRLIVVLAGLHDSLRAQTQGRLDEGFLGFDTQQKMVFDQSNTRIGVGKLPGPFHIAHSLTSSAQKGDFNLKVAKNAGVVVGGKDPVLLVVKKNASILNNLTRWATLIQQQHNPISGKKLVSGVPLLIIDDEADNASINTKAIPLDEFGNLSDEYNPTKINGLIRKLLQSFEQSAYVGYTATPFANIFIDNATENSVFGKDLFPRSFIINLPAPSNYIGPVQLFGLEGDPEFNEGLPIIREIDDQSDWVPDGHKKDLVPGLLPQSLKKAVYSFILACAARSARGQQKVHNSMLIHVTRFTAVQSEIEEQVKDLLSSIKKHLRYGSGNGSLQVLNEFQNLWTTDFNLKTHAFDKYKLAPLTWADVSPFLSPAAEKIEVRKINGTVKDALEYNEHPEGFSCIAIGGDKLSRGLTLEGLTVSYYLRASKMYDTLMQMGRWFGYRDGYVDLCRLYTTAELVDWYKYITLASEELRQEFDYMASTGATPADFGLRVRTHPANLLVTAANKMKSGTPVQISFSDTISETIIFDTNPAQINNNFNLTDNFLVSLGKPLPPESGGIALKWRSSDTDAVLTFIEAFSTHPGARKVQTAVLASYIQSRIQDNELVEWVIGLAQGSGSECIIGGHKIKTVIRSKYPPKESTDNTAYRIRRLVSPADETIDLSPSEKIEALEKTIKMWEANPGRSTRTEPPVVPSGPGIRNTRPATRGLILLYPLVPKKDNPVHSGNPFIGLAISFPKSNTAKTVTYIVNNIYWEQEYGEQEYAFE